MFTIGEFSKLTHISSRMLRYYDIMGVLRPALTGSNGYRYYELSQLKDILQIERLKGYGFKLAEIKKLILLPESEQAIYIHKRRLKAYDELNNIRKSIHQMEKDIIKMEGSDMALKNYHVIVMNIPSQKVFSIRRKINISEIHDLFQELIYEMKIKGLGKAGVTQALYHGEEFSYENMDIEAQVQVTGQSEYIKDVEEMTCAAVTHVGTYETIKYAYDALCKWLSEHSEYEVCGPAIERYIKDENMVLNDEDLETGVLFPIKKIV